MDRLCDEILQLILFELNDPTSFTLLSKRFHRFSQDPYVRAQYFLTRHGHIQAMFWALGRGKLMNDRVLDILLASGAQLSRYLIQVAIHHYFRTTSHFVKTQWVRSVPLPVFSYFLKLASQLYGDVPVGKGEDDGAVFGEFLKESRFPIAMKSIAWEEIRDIMEKYKFIPFSPKDPTMVTFPLALAIEPRLLPYAVQNGFRMDAKYRDFVFRKMFERPMVGDTRTDEIIHNVRELNKLDPTMFLSRTVAAEVCMEAKTNESAYTALKKLDQQGELLFDLSTLVEELIKLFIKTRSITHLSTIQVLRQLFADFPTSDSTVRTVIILTVFLSDNCLTHTTPATLKSKLEPLGLTPLTRKDVLNVLVNPFVERYSQILEYALAEVGLGNKEVRELVEEVAVRCLEIGCKGKMLKKLFEGFPFLHDSVAIVVAQRFQIGLDDLPDHEDEQACARYEARLCRDFIIPKFSEETPSVDLEEGGGGAQGGGEAGGEGEEVAGVHEGDEDSEVDVGEDDRDELVEGAEAANAGDNLELGRIGQDTLSAMIRRDELAPTRSRRRVFYGYPVYYDSSQKLNYPSDHVQVGRWIREEFGLRSRVTAVFMTHAVINDNTHILHQYLPYIEAPFRATSLHVPITLKHFKLLARLGRAPGWCLYHEVEKGAEFYFSEEDYLVHQDHSLLEPKPKLHGRVKTEATPIPIPISSPSRGRKRPRRAAAAVCSYAVPDSDDEAILDEDEDETVNGGARAKRKVETNLQRWIKHLSILHKEEQKKYKEKKKRIERSARPDEKVRVPRNEFLKSLSINLRNLRKTDREARLLLYGPEVIDDDYSDGDDDEYQCRTNRTRRRRTAKTL